MKCKKSLKGEIEHIAVSAGIGLMVGSANLLFLLSEYIGVKTVIISLMIAAVIGIGIGYAARAAFSYIMLKLSENIVLAYVIEAVVVFCVTIGTTYFFVQNNWVYLFLSGMIAVILAMVFTYYIRLKGKKLNAKLKEFQNEK